LLENAANNDHDESPRRFRGTGSSCRWSLGFWWPRVDGGVCSRKGLSVSWSSDFPEAPLGNSFLAPGRGPPASSSSRDSPRDETVLKASRDCWARSRQAVLFHRRLLARASYDLALQINYFMNALDLARFAALLRPARVVLTFFLTRTSCVAFDEIPGIAASLWEWEAYCTGPGQIFSSTRAHLRRSSKKKKKKTDNKERRSKPKEHTHTHCHDPKKKQKKNENLKNKKAPGEYRLVARARTKISQGRSRDKLQCPRRLQPHRQSMRPGHR